MRQRLSRATSAAIEAFTNWFTSPAAFIQGTVVTVVWLVAVLVGFDPRGWWLLFVFTVFSGITQFPLAYAARRAADASDRALAEIDREMEILEQLATNSIDTLRALLHLLESQTSETGRADTSGE